MSHPGVPIPTKTAAMEEDDDLSVLLSRSAPRIERHKTVVPIHQDDVEYSDFDRAIVIAIDESPNSEPVVSWAAERILRRRKDLVVLVNVQPESKSWRTSIGTRKNARSLDGDDVVVSQIDEEAKERCRSILSPYAERLQRDGFVVKGICLIGNPKEVLVASSNVKKPTMIIMGTHGRGTVKRFLMGSVAEYVLHHSTIPVVVVPNGSFRPVESE
ncbi:hypothetical protein LPJ77_000832 [Coemansia sp. RSA 2523]|nr:hypothetical protein LPJ58_002402 [Coemansia sp. RSA 1591]KAJ1763646.1 hypothetical protein LPJ69_002342 [Coemansia sp. RSA 1752]KAJ1780134.1 hypothetical protein LPJ54_000376 [Coemansia sp. RSA 1824]KAJ1789431.1 hypothetical protein LPJ62_002427 [Coemansia sp. RSA 2167]KAJ1789991.1 hypothetical protein LPJ67_002303 [Coemansia sp. RSA 1938]KAJ1810505.1 hypothetical protein LPJ77_000832 [Coemansia sp. RSA 2523]KAJ2105865.1 hypothetical protein GGF48_006229 [Coemansia sp. RSA 921]KAJ2112345